MKKTLLISLASIIGIGIIVGAYFILHSNSGKNSEESSNGLTIIPTLQEKISGNTARCATFQLVRNDMMNEVVKGPVIFSPQLAIAKHLNTQEFTANMLSPNYYYTKFGLKTLALKADIEQGIRDKFQEKSAILDQIDWSDGALNGAKPNEKRYIFYAMLKRVFNFPNKFEVLPIGNFGKGNNRSENIEYFGVENKSTNYARQITVLFYNNADNYAVKLTTNEGDEVILYRNINEKSQNFNEVYENLLKQQENFIGRRGFQEVDTLKVPKLNFNEQRVYSEFEDKTFPTGDPEYPIGEIYKAIQSIEFTIDEAGGKIKSEAIIDMIRTNSAMPIREEVPEPRHFNFDDTFYLFLQEQGKEKPYFALKVVNMENFQ